LELILEGDEDQHTVMKKQDMWYVYEKWDQYCEYVKQKIYRCLYHPRFPIKTSTDITLTLMHFFYLGHNILVW
jgi:hypothetical protein